MKLLDIINENKLNEQASFSRFLSKTLPSLGQTFEHNFFTELRRSLNKDLSTITPKELSAAFKLPQMAAYRKQIADKLIETDFDVVDNILKKYDLTVPQQSINAGKELAQTLDVDPAFLKDVKQSYLTKKSTGQAGQITAQATAQAATPIVNANGVIDRMMSAPELRQFISGKDDLYPFLFKDGRMIPALEKQLPDLEKQFVGKSIEEVRQGVLPILQSTEEMVIKNAAISKEKKQQLLKTIGNLRFGIKKAGITISVILGVSIIADFIYKSVQKTKETGNVLSGTISGTGATAKDIYKGVKDVFTGNEQPQQQQPQQQQQQQQQQQKPAIPGASPTKTNKGWASNL